MPTRLSITQVQMLYVCPRKWYLRYVLKQKGDPVFALSFGAALHSFIGNYMLRPIRGAPRPFYYKSLESSVSAWKRMWLTTWEETIGIKFEHNEKLKYKGMNDGEKCVINYYKLMQDRARPRYVEKKVKLYLSEIDVMLEGVIDQIIRGVNGWVGVDLKTGSNSFWYEGNTDLQNAKKQAGLVNNIQASAYYLLSKQLLGEWLAAFCFVMLGPKTHNNAGVIHTTTRTETDIEEFIRTLESAANIIRRGNDISDFPKTGNTYQCTSCESASVCASDGGKLKLSRPITSNTPEQIYQIAMDFIPGPQQNTQPKQIRMRFKK